MMVPWAIIVLCGCYTAQSAREKRRRGLPFGAGVLRLLQVVCIQIYYNYYVEASVMKQMAHPMREHERKECPPNNETQQRKICRRSPSLTHAPTRTCTKKPFFSLKKSPPRSHRPHHKQHSLFDSLTVHQNSQNVNTSVSANPHTIGILSLCAHCG
jgi:hypothetical protein